MAGSSVGAGLPPHPLTMMNGNLELSGINLTNMNRGAVREDDARRSVFKPDSSSSA
jgi:hypothetical protein